MSEYKLTEEIVARSDGKTWDVARFEWRLEDVCKAGQVDKCTQDDPSQHDHATGRRRSRNGVS